MKKIIVIKLGSSILITKREKLDEFRIGHIADQVVALKEAGFGVVLIVSGAVACGHKFIQHLLKSQQFTPWKKGAGFINFSQSQRFLRQVAAGLGQVVLTSTFTNIFNQKKMNIAQILLTKNNLDSIFEKQKIRDLLKFYIQSGFIPMINENDVLDLNSFGGNDLLSVEIAKLVGANKVTILSTMDGSIHGIGGGATKIEAIKILSQENIETKIVNGKEKNILVNSLII